VPKYQVPLEEFCVIKYPIGEKVPIKFRTMVSIKLGNCLMKLPVVVMEDDCLLGVDFLLMVGLDIIFEPFSGRKETIFGEKETLICSI